MIGVKMNGMLDTYDYKDYFIIIENELMWPKKVSADPSIHFFNSNQSSKWGRVNLRGITIEDFEKRLIHKDKINEYPEYLV